MAKRRNPAAAEMFDAMMTNYDHSGKRALYIEK
jgi:hypothetical protein